MLDEHRAEFAKDLMALGSLYDRVLKREQIEIYWRALSDVDLADFREAIAKHARDPDRGRFFPKPADLIYQLEGASEDEALAAWVEARSYLSGSSRVLFLNPATYTAMAALGWDRLSRMDHRDLQFVGKEFVAVYREAKRTGRVSEPRPMGGIGYAGDEGPVVRVGACPLRLVAPVPQIKGGAA